MKLFKLFFGLLLITLIVSWKSDSSNCKNSVYLLNQVKGKYDTQDQWQEADLKVHIQEPRVGNPVRHTKLTLKNAEDYFEMERFREDGIVKRILTGNGESTIMLNGEADLSQEIIDQYRLYAERSKGYKRFYTLMYGLPMSLTDDLWEAIKPAEKAQYEGKEVYRIALSLKEPMISKHWTLIVGVDTYELLALEFNHPEESGSEEEIIKFESTIEISGVKIPRIRNWYVKGTNEYLGTDVIVREIE